MSGDEAVTGDGVVTYQDKWVTCADCRDNFLWGAKEQELYAEKGYPPPTRCKGCKQAQRAGPRKEVGKR